MSDLDPWQREHEFADVIMTLLIAVSRYGKDDESGRDTDDRLDTLRHITVLVADGVAERVRRLRGNEAAAAFRKALGRRQP